MAVKAPSAAFAWLFWLLWVAGWIIMLSGASALQQVRCKSYMRCASEALPGEGGSSLVTPSCMGRHPVFCSHIPFCDPMVQDCSKSNVTVVAGTVGYLVRPGCTVALPRLAAASCLWRQLVVPPRLPSTKLGHLHMARAPAFCAQPFPVPWQPCQGMSPAWACDDMPACQTPAAAALAPCPRPPSPAGASTRSPGGPRGMVSWGRAVGLLCGRSSFFDSGWRALHG